MNKEIIPLDYVHNEITPLEAKKQELKIVEANLKLRISTHAPYIGSDRKPGSGKPVGLALQINKRTLAAFGCAREDYNLHKYTVLVSMQTELLELFDREEAEKTTRAKIKIMVYKTITQFGELARSA